MATRGRVGNLLVAGRKRERGRQDLFISVDDSTEFIRFSTVYNQMPSAYMFPNAMFFRYESGVYYLKIHLLSSNKKVVEQTRKRLTFFISTTTIPGVFTVLLKSSWP